MPLEIERRFLVIAHDWRPLARPGRRFCRGDVAKFPAAGVRVRRAGNGAFLTFKGSRQGIARPEYEYPIPVDDAEELLKLFCQRPVAERTRHEAHCEGLVCEVDVFAGDAPLILAEVELDATDQTSDAPVGEEPRSSAIPPTAMPPSPRPTANDRKVPMPKQVRNPWIRLGWDAWMLGAEAASVMTLRTLMIAGGRDPDGREARRMVSEKLDAALALQGLALTGALGATAPAIVDKTLKHYRRKVRANRRRLQR